MTYQVTTPTSVGQVTLVVRGDEALKKLSKAIYHHTETLQILAASTVLNYIETVQQSVPDFMKEKISVQVVPTGYADYLLYFSSRGEPRESGKRKIFEEKSQKIITVQESGSMDTVISMHLNKEVAEAAPVVQEEALYSYQEVTENVLHRYDIKASMTPTLSAPRTGMSIVRNI